MNTNLSLYETRVIGCLIEKAITTPDQYPLSINALTNACNQKSNRDPVFELSEQTVQETVDELVKKFLISRVQGGRVTKYRHRFCNSEFGSLQLPEKAVGIICELFLRGPQTPGELRTHTERLSKFDTGQEVEQELERLMTRDEPLVIKLPREPGKREARYAHLFSGEPQSSDLSATEDTIKNVSLKNRIETLEQHVAELQLKLDELNRKLDHLSQFNLK